MNLLENYIIEVHSEKLNAYGGVTAEVTVNCYGNTRKTIHYSLSKEEWEKEKKQGYFMA